MCLFGCRVAELSTRGRPGEVICRYTDDARARWPANTPRLSCSIPLVTKAVQAGIFFRGLLPEGTHRHGLADRAGVATCDTFGLLTRYGARTMRDDGGARRRRAARVNRQPNVPATCRGGLMSHRTVPPAGEPPCEGGQPGRSRS